VGGWRTVSWQSRARKLFEEGSVWRGVRYRAPGANTGWILLDTKGNEKTCGRAAMVQRAVGSRNTRNQMIPKWELRPHRLLLRVIRKAEPGSRSAVTDRKRRDGKRGELRLSCRGAL